MRHAAPGRGLVGARSRHDQRELLGSGQGPLVGSGPEYAARRRDTSYKGQARLGTGRSRTRTRDGA